MRAYEQIRNDVCYHNLDVKIIGTGGGYNYGNHGVTHHTVEDIAIMSVLPNMKVFNPGYSQEATDCTKALLKDGGPCYMRLGKSPGKDFSKPEFNNENSDILLLATGNILDYAFETADLLKDFTTQVVSMPIIKPLDVKKIVKMAQGRKLVVTLEEHSVYGGIGSQVGSALAEVEATAPFLPLAIPDTFIKTVGGRAFLLKEAGLDPLSISKKIIWKLKK
jgi:transketolase